MKTSSISQSTFLSFSSMRKISFIILLLLLVFNQNCKKDPVAPDACFNADKVHAAFVKVKNFLAANEAAYNNGTIETSKIGLYIDMVATKIRMTYYSDVLSVKIGSKVIDEDGTVWTVDNQLISDYKVALCNETDDVNKKL
jgi:hypothetical protein